MIVANNTPLRLSPVTFLLINIILTTMFFKSITTISLLTRLIKCNMTMTETITRAESTMIYLRSSICFLNDFGILPIKIANSRLIQNAISLFLIIRFNLIELSLTLILQPFKLRLSRIKLCLIGISFGLSIFKFSLSGFMQHFCIIEVTFSELK